jgi:hypothetical protein
VTRWVRDPASLPEAILNAFFVGPTPEEQAQGLFLVTSGFSGYSQLTIEGGMARIYLTGTCASSGAAYSVAGPLVTNLRQFPEVQWVKIYDADGNTENPDGEGNSIPFCLEP